MPLAWRSQALMFRWRRASCAAAVCRTTDMAAFFGVGGVACKDNRRRGTFREAAFGEACGVGHNRQQLGRVTGLLCLLASPRS